MVARIPGFFGGFVYLQLRGMEGQCESDKYAIIAMISDLDQDLVRIYILLQANVVQNADDLHKRRRSQSHGLCGVKGEIHRDRIERYLRMLSKALE